MRRVAVAGSAVALLVGALVLIFVVVKANAVNLDGIQCVIHTEAPALPETSHDYKGGKIYFCCFGCPVKFDRDPKVFATRANLQLVATLQARQHQCPLSGRDLDKTTEITVAGAKVAFCSGTCKAQVEAANGDDQINLVLSDEAFERAGFKVEKK